MRQLRNETTTQAPLWSVLKILMTLALSVWNAYEFYEAIIFLKKKKKKFRNDTLRNACVYWCWFLSKGFEGVKLFSRALAKICSKYV